MTPQEKAREILIQMQFQSHPLMFEQAKICALIAVDEVIKSNPCEESCDRGGNFMFMNNVFYWEQVKQEIEKL